MAWWTTTRSRGAEERGKYRTSDEFARVISEDPALAARLIELSNSSVFSVGHEVTTLERACVVPGLKTVRLMALSFSMTEASGGVGWRRRILLQAVLGALSIHRSRGSRLLQLERLRLGAPRTSSQRRLARRGERPVTRRDSGSRIPSVRRPPCRRRSSWSPGYRRSVAALPDRRARRCSDSARRGRPSCRSRCCRADRRAPSTSRR